MPVQLPTNSETNNCPYNRDAAQRITCAAVYSFLISYVQIQV